MSKVYDPVSADENLYRETSNIVRYTVCRKSHNTETVEAKRLLELVEELFNEHDVFGCICGKLRLTRSNMIEVYRTVAESMFEDGLVSWGRLVSLVAFSVKMSEYFNGECQGLVVELTTEAIFRIAGSWILSQGGWASLANHFPQKKERRLRNDSWVKGLLVTATATLGIGALFAVTCR